MNTPELTIPTENKTSVEVRQATANDIEDLARVQWFARKQGVEQGYLPERVLGLHPGEPSPIPDALGIRYAAGELTRHYMMNPKDDDVILSARIDGGIVGKSSLAIKDDLKVAEFDSLDILPEFQGKGIALKLQNESVRYVRKHFSSVKTIRIGRFKESTEYAQKNFHKNSFFNALLSHEKATLEEKNDRGAFITWINVPIDIYEEEVQKRLTAK